MGQAVTEYEKFTKIARVHFRTGSSYQGSRPERTLCGEVLAYCKTRTYHTDGGFVDGSPIYGNLTQGDYELTVCVECEELKPQREANQYEGEINGEAEFYDCRRGCGREVEHYDDLCDRCYEASEQDEEP